MRMMIVDDNRQLCENMRDGIDWQAMGIDRVSIALNGRQAVEIFEEFQPDLIVLDVRMPDMTGLEFLKIAKARRPEVKVIMISGYAQFEYAAEAMRHGASMYELKPLSMEKLLRDVSKLLEEIRAGRDRQRLSEVHRQAYREAVLKDNLLGVREDPAEAARFLEKELGLDPRGWITVMCAAIDGARTGPAPEGALMLEQVARTLLRGEEGRLLLLRDGARFYLGAATSSSGAAQAEARRGFQRLLKRWNEAVADTGLSLSAGVGEARPMREIGEACRQAVFALEDVRMAGCSRSVRRTWHSGNRRKRR